MLRAFVLLAATLAAALWRLGAHGTTFAALAAPPVVDRPAKTSTDTGERPSGEGKVSKKSERPEGKFNATLQLYSGRPGINSVPIGNGPPWATCTVVSPESPEPGQAEGQTALETWVMLGDSEVVS